MAKTSGNKSIVSQRNDFTQIPSNELADRLVIDEEVERMVIQSKVIQIQTYIANSIENNQIAFLPPIIASSRQIDGKNVILDGQHRFLALTTMMESKAVDGLRVDNVLEKLKEYKIGVNIVEADSIESEKQIFSDINFNATKVQRSLAISFNSRDEIQRLISKTIEKNTKLKSLVNIGKGKPEHGQIIKISVIYDAVNQLLYGTSRPKQGQLKVIPKNTDQSTDQIVENWLDILAKNVISSNKSDLSNHGAFIQAVGLIAHAEIESSQNWADKVVNAVMSVKSIFDSKDWNELANYFAITTKSDKKSMELPENEREKKVVIGGTGSALNSFVSLLNHYKN